MADYLPLTDDGLRNWSANFSALIGVEPADYGLTAEQVTAYATRATGYALTLAAATNPSTRGSATVLEKNTTKAALITMSRTLAMQVTNNPLVTDQQRHDLGLTVRDPEPTPVPPPSESPTLDITSVKGWTVHYRLHNGEATNRAKPAGVTGAFVFTYVGDAAPTDLEAWKFEGTASKTITKIVFPGTLAPGTRVWITAAWVNAKLETGPACTPVFTQINYGGMSQAA
ncbi:MAG: hypothetical protein WD042_13095 [Phycisphaeraceae bacterium]